MKKFLMVFLVFALVLSLSAAVMPKEPAGHSRGLSVIPLKPSAEEALRTQGRPIRTVFPNSLNNGKKFNPGGEVLSPIPTQAEQNVLVLFASFTTPPPGGPEARLNLSYYDQLLFGTVYNPPEYAAFQGYPVDRTLKNYYSEVSYGKIDVVTLNMPSDQGWMNTGHPYDYYTRADGIHDNGFGPYPENVQGIVETVVKAADPFVDYSQYAVNGVVPNLFVVYAGTGAEWSGAADLIWSHSWSLSDSNPALADGLTVDNVKIDNYAMMPEVGGDLTAFTGIKTGPYPPTVGVFAHEYGHVLGLPDQYDYGYESQGTGRFSLMAGGSWNQSPGDDIFSGNSPAHLDAWSKYMLGFVDPIEVTSLTKATLPPVEIEPVVYKMDVPYSGGKEYFLLENRQNIGFDEGLRWRGYLDQLHGLAIYHVDETVLYRNYWRPNEAENWKEFRSESNKKAPNGERHYGISILQADDLWELERGLSSGNMGDLYPGSYGVTSFGNFTFPNSSAYYFWGGSQPKFGYSGVTVQNIAEVLGGPITADLSFKPWSAKK